MTRIAVLAYSETGYECLKALLDRGETVVLVVTHPDTVGESIWFPSVAELARSGELPWLSLPEHARQRDEPERVGDPR